MIIRSIIFDPEDPYRFHVEYNHCSVCREKATKKRIGKMWRNVYPYLRVIHTTFYEDGDFDDV